MPLPRSPLARRLLVLAASTLACLLLLELGLRVRAYVQDRGILQEALAGRTEPPPSSSTILLQDLMRLHPDDRIVYDLYPGVHDVELKYVRSDVSTTVDGFRDQDLAVEKPEGTLRIVGLGDSVLFGWGCRQGEDLLGQLGELLRETEPGVRWETLNTGVPGYNTTMEVAAFEEKALKYDPDLVLLVVVGNDLSLPNFIREERLYASLSESFLVELVLELLGHRRRAPDMRQPPRFLSNARDEDEDRPGRKTRDPEQVPTRYRGMVGWEAYGRALDELVRLSEAHGFELMAVAFYNHDVQERMLEMAAERGFLTAHFAIMLREHFRESGSRRYRSSDLVIGETDPHPSALAHRLAARFSLERMRESGLLERLVARVAPSRGGG